MSIQVDKMLDLAINIKFRLSFTSFVTKSTPASSINILNLWLATWITGILLTSELDLLYEVSWTV